MPRWPPTTARWLGPVLIGVILTLVPAASGAAEQTGDDASQGWVGPDPGLRSVVAQLAKGLSVASRWVVQDRGAVWAWPLDGSPPVVNPFDAPAQRWLPGHRGVDLGGVAGEPVRAVADGVVLFSGVIAGVGVLSVQHPDGLRSTYQPVRDRIARGTQVSSGHELGTLEHQGHCLPRTCLHLGAKRGEAYVDPLLLLQGWEVSLLPLD